MTGCRSLVVVHSDVFRKRLDFRMGVAHGLASRASSENVYVEFRDASGNAGYGECVPRQYVTGETPGSALAVLGEFIPALTAGTYESPDAVIAALAAMGRSEAGRKNPAALCAVELSLLDLAGKHWGISVTEMLGLTRSVAPLAYSLVVPLLPSGALEKFLAYVAEFEFRHVKIKVTADDPAGQVRRVRSVLHPDTEFRADANCSWKAADAPRFMRELHDEGVVSIEQPLPADDLAGMARLRNGGPLVTLDESVSGPDDVTRAAESGACDIVNVRISKCGGMLGALRVIGAARRNGLGVQLGAQVGESCILSAAGAILASGTPEFRWLEGGFGEHLLREDMCAKPFCFGRRGLLAPPSGPGLGMPVERDRLLAG